MNEKEVFARLCSLLQQNKEMSFVTECVDMINQEMVLFHPGSIMEKNHVYETYKDRFEIQKNITKANVLGYAKLLSEISHCTVNKIWVMNLVTGSNSYFIFSDERLTLLLGILKSPYSNLEKVLNLQHEYVAKGLTFNFETFVKGQSIN